MTVTFDPAKRSTFIGSYRPTLSNGNLTVQGTDFGSTVYMGVLGTDVLTDAIGYVEFKAVAPATGTGFNPRAGFVDDGYDTVINGGSTPLGIAAGEAAAVALTQDGTGTGSDVYVVYLGSTTLAAAPGAGAAWGAWTGLIFHKATGKFWIIAPDNSIYPDTPVFDGAGGLTSGTGYASGLSNLASVWFAVTTGYDESIIINVGDQTLVRTRPANVPAGWNKAGGGGPVTTPISCLASTAPVASIKRAAAKTLAAATAPVASRRLGVAMIKLASSAAVALLTRSASRTARANSSSVATLTRTPARTALAASSSTARLVRSAGKIAQASSSSTARLVRASSKTALAASAAIATAKRSATKSAQAASAAIASLASGKAFLRSFQATTAPIASLTSLKLKLITAQASSNAVATVNRASTKLALASSNAVASLAKSATRSLLAASLSTASLSRSAAKLLRAITSPIASLSRSGAYIPPAVPAGRNVAIVEKGSRSVSIVEVGSRHVDLG